MYKKILAPLDGSPLAECSLSHVKTLLADSESSQAVLLTVIESPTNQSFGEPINERAANAMAEQREKTEKEVRQNAVEYLKNISDGLKKEEIAVQAEVVQPELNIGVAETILKYAQDNKVDLILMSTHGRSGVSRWAFGSVAEKVVRHSTIPVMTITATGCRLAST